MKYLGTVIGFIKNNKKLTATIVSFVIAVARQKGIDLPVELIHAALAYVVGQGAADIGKEAKKIEMATIEKMGGQVNPSQASTK